MTIYRVININKVKRRVNHINLLLQYFELRLIDCFIIWLLEKLNFFFLTFVNIYRLYKTVE